MIRFDTMEKAGLAVAAMSDKTDGNCGDANARESFLERLDIRPEQLVRLRQVHGVRVLDADDVESNAATPPEADGIITTRRNIALGIGVADCAPVLLYHPAPPAVAVLHAGREGTRHNIAAAGVRALCTIPEVHPAGLLALVGPCAGACCYEVSEDMAADWTAAGLPTAGRHLDISGAICAQLEYAGVIRHNIRVVPHCTVCGGGFYSYRADKTSDRNLVVVML